MESIKNKKAYFNYFFEETFEAGLVLQGWEVKSMLNRSVNFENAHLYIKNGEIFILNLQINPLITAPHYAESARTRKLLLHKKEIMEMIGKVERKSFALVPVKIYKKKNKFKVEIALARGKKTYDKKEILKARDLNRETNLILKSKNKIS